MPKMRSYPMRKWLVAGTVTVLAGCGTGGPSLGAQQTGQAAPQGQAQMPQQQDPQQDPLGLTEEQQKQLAQSFRALEPDDTQKQAMQTIQSLLLADQVDLAGLTEALNTSRQGMVDNVDKVIRMFQGLRETLDVNQRNKLTALLQQQINQQAQQPQFPPELKLTQQQQAALAALQPDQKQMNQALIDFLQTGDQEALRIAVTNDIAAMPTPDVVAGALAGLNKEQRQQMFGMPDQMPQQQAGAPQRQ